MTTMSKDDWLDLDKTVTRVARSQMKWFQRHCRKLDKKRRRRYQHQKRKQ